MRNKGWRRVIVLLLALVMGTGMMIPARAENYEDQYEMAAVHWGMAAVFKMLAEAVDKPHNLPEGMFDDLMTINVMNPDQVFLVMMDDLDNILDNGVLDTAAGALADARMSAYDADYAAAARKLYARISGEKTGLDNSIMVMVYGPHVLLASVYHSGVNGTYLIRSLAGSLTLDDALMITSFFGKPGDIMAYEGESLEKLLTLDHTVHGGNAANYIWSAGVPSAKSIRDTVCWSEDRLRALFPKVAGEPRMDQEVVMGGLFDYIMLNYSLDTARMAARELIPLFGNGGGAAFMDYVRGVTDSDLKKMPAPEIDYKDGENRELKENATYLVVVERQNADHDPVIGCDMVTESALPPEAVPETPEVADYIIRVTADWNGGKYVQGDLEVYYVNIRVGVYDAVTGEMVKDLGGLTQKLTGYMRVSSRITYLNPYRDNIWSLIARLFR